MSIIQGTPNAELDVIFRIEVGRRLDGLAEWVQQNTPNTSVYALPHPEGKPNSVWGNVPVSKSTINRDSNEEHGGAFAARFDIDTPGQTAFLQQEITLVPGAAYTFSIWYKTEAGKTIVFGIRDGYLGNVTGTIFLKSDDTWATEWNEAWLIVLPEATTWTKYTLPFHAHASLSSCTLQVGHTQWTSTEVASSFYLDDISILDAGSSEVLTDGALENWSDAAHLVAWWGHFPSICLADSLKYGEEASIEDCQGNVGSWFYNVTTLVLYIHAYASVDPRGAMLVLMSLFWRPFGNKIMDVDGTPSEPLLDKNSIPGITQEISLLSQGGTKASFGTIKLNNESHFFYTDPSAYEYQAKKVECWVGNTGSVFASFGKYFIGWSGDIEINDSEMNLNVEDMRLYVL